MDGEGGGVRGREDAGGDGAGRRDRGMAARGPVAGRGWSVRTVDGDRKGLERPCPLLRRRMGARTPAAVLLASALVLSAMPALDAVSSGPSTVVVDPHGDSGTFDALDIVEVRMSAWVSDRVDDHDVPDRAYLNVTVDLDKNLDRVARTAMALSRGGWVVGWTGEDGERYEVRTWMSLVAAQGTGDRPGGWDLVRLCRGGEEVLDADRRGLRWRAAPGQLVASLQVVPPGGSEMDVRGTLTEPWARGVHYGIPTHLGAPSTTPGCGTGIAYEADRAPDAGVGEDLAVPHPSQLVIGTMLPLTGDLGVFGPSGEDAVRLAIAQVNAEGGVNGHDVVHVGGDTETSGTAALREAARLIGEEGVRAIVGAYSDGVSLSFIDRAVQARVPMVSPANTFQTFTSYLDDGYYLRTAPSDAFQAEVLAQHLVDRNVSRAAILAINNDHGVRFADVFVDEFEDLGAGRVIIEHVKYDPEGTSFDSDVQDVTDEDPEVVVLVAFPSTGAEILRTAHEQGVAGPDSPIDWALTDGVFTANFPDQVGQTEDGRYIVEDMTGTTPELFLESSIPEAFVQMYRDAYGEDPTPFAPGAYDSAVLLALASEACGCTDGPGLRDALFAVMNPPGQKVGDVAEALQRVRAEEDIDYSGFAGDQDWDGVGDTTTGVYSLYRFAADGTIAIDETGIEAGAT